jgi:hypothetical protein
MDNCSKLCCQIQQTLPKIQNDDAGVEWIKNKGLHDLDTWLHEVELYVHGTNSYSVQFTVVYRQQSRLFGRKSLTLSMVLTFQGQLVTSVTKGGTQKFPQKFKIVGTYWHDLLGSSWGALSDGTISFSIRFLGKRIFWIFLKKPQSLKN